MRVSTALKTQFALISVRELIIDCITVDSVKTRPLAINGSSIVLALAAANAVKIPKKCLKFSTVFLSPLILHFKY